MANKPMNLPAPYAVYVEVTEKSGEVNTFRCCPASSLEDAKLKIEKEREGLKQTYGGLFDSPATCMNREGKKYRHRVFKAEWTEVQM